MLREYGDLLPSLALFNTLYYFRNRYIYCLFLYLRCLNVIRCSKTNVNKKYTNKVFLTRKKNKYILPKKRKVLGLTWCSPPSVRSCRHRSGSRELWICRSHSPWSRTLDMGLGLGSLYLYWEDKEQAFLTSCCIFDLFKVCLFLLKVCWLMC